MSRKRHSQLEDDEIALVKAMLERNIAKDRIQSFFSRPDRVVNYGRIYNIKAGKLGANISVASDDALEEFFTRWRDQGSLLGRDFELGPLDDAVLAKMFRFSGNKSARIECDETDRVEFKEAFHLGKFPRYARLAAALANRRGGYLLFGIEDKTKKLVGLSSDTFEKTDIGAFSQRINAFIQPSVTCSKRIWTARKKVLGVLYVEASPSPPVVATRDGDGICDGAIYYRYPGCSDTIKHGDLLALLSERDRRTGAVFMRQVQKIAEAGVSQASVLNHVSGEISGPAGSLIIDESLLEKIKFILEGCFVEVGGSPTLRIIGDVTPVEHSSIQPVKTVKSSLGPYDILGDFIQQRRVDDPLSYIRQSVHFQQVLLPIFYYIYLADISADHAISEISSQPTNRVKSRETLIRRIKKRAGVSVPRGHVTEQYRERITSGQPIKFGAISDRHYAIRSLRTISEKGVNFEVCMETLRRAWNDNKANPDPVFLNEIRYAATHIDAVVFGPKVA